MFRNLGVGAVVKRLKVDGANYQVVAGTTDVLTSESVDTRGFGAALFIPMIGAISATGTVATKVTTSSDDAVTDAYSDVAGTANNYTATDDNKVALTDIYQPRKPWLKFVMTRATANAAVDGLLVILYNPQNAPVTLDSMVVNGAVVTLNSPAEGTP